MLNGSYAQDFLFPFVDLVLEVIPPGPLHHRRNQSDSYHPEG